MHRQTIFSPCRIYRYVLWRDWDVGNRGYVMFVGLNPSTADEVADDPTIRRCTGYAKQWGYGALCMTNLFALRATDPRVLKTHPSPVGADNDRWLVETAKGGDVVVAAWGVHGAHRGRDHAVMRLLGARLMCLGLTKDGRPRHPLYLKKGLTPIPFGDALCCAEASDENRTVSAPCLRG